MDRGGGHDMHLDSSAMARGEFCCEAAELNSDASASARGLQIIIPDLTDRSKKILPEGSAVPVRDIDVTVY